MPAGNSVGAFGSARRKSVFTKSPGPSSSMRAAWEQASLAPTFFVSSSKEQHRSSRIVNCSSTIIWHHIAMPDEHHRRLPQATDNNLSAVSPTLQHRIALAGIAVIGFAIGMVHILNTDINHFYYHTPYHVISQNLNTGIKIHRENR